MVGVFLGLRYFVLDMALRSPGACYGYGLRYKRWGEGEREGEREAKKRGDRIIP